jgi:hypothetical protein
MGKVAKESGSFNVSVSKLNPEEPLQISLVKSGRGRGRKGDFWGKPARRPPNRDSINSFKEGLS